MTFIDFQIECKTVHFALQFSETEFFIKVEPPMELSINKQQ